MDKSERAEQAARDQIYEAYELAVELGTALTTARDIDKMVVVSRSKLRRLISIVPMIAGYAMAAMPLTPMPIKANRARAKAIEHADPQLCCEALALILKHVDYTSRRCTFTEQIGAVLPVEVIHQARVALNAYKLRGSNEPPTS